jgi:hypothetical protein
MNDHRKSPLEATAPDGKRSLLTRRKILKVGVGSAPVLLTLMSRPVLGAECLPCSAVGSTLHASHSSRVSTCSGLAVSSWTRSSTVWPDPYKRGDKNSAHGWTGTAYHCSTTGLCGTTFSGKSMLEVMQLSDDGGVRSTGRYITAALLNSRSNRTPVLSETTVRGMWNDFVNKGYYEPTAGVRWGPQQIIAYITSTMG